MKIFLYNLGARCLKDYAKTPGYKGNFSVANFFFVFNLCLKLDN